MCPSVAVVTIPGIVVSAVYSDGISEASESPVQLLSQNKLVTQQSVRICETGVHLKQTGGYQANQKQSQEEPWNQQECCLRQTLEVINDHKKKIKQNHMKAKQAQVKRQKKPQNGTLLIPEQRNRFDGITV